MLQLQNKKIAKKLFVSSETIKAHQRNIYQKRNVSNRRQAVDRAKALGLFIEPVTLIVTAPIIFVPISTRYPSST